MMKILFLTYYWPPAGGPGVQRSVKFVKYFPFFGVKASVISVDPSKGNYPVLDSSLSKEVDSQVEVIRTGSFEPFELYGKLKGGKKQAGYDAFVNEAVGSFKDKLARFIRGNFFIPDARRGWNSFAYNAAREQLVNTKDIQCVFTSSPPHSTQLIGLKLKKQLSLPWVADLRDPWTDIYYKDLLLQTFLAKRLNASYEKKVLENADAVLVVSEPIRQLFIAKSPKINPDKIHVIPNGFDESDFEGLIYRPNSEFIITYTGTISQDYNIGTFLKVAATLNKGLCQGHLKLRFVGKISKGLLEQIENEGLSKQTEFIAHVTHEEALKYMTGTEMLLLAIPDKKGNEGILTGKLFEYLAALRPVLGIGPVNGSAAAIVEECEAGIFVDYRDEEKMSVFLSEKFEQWKNGNQTNNINNVYLKYSRKSQACLVADIIKGLV